MEKRTVAQKNEARELGYIGIDESLEIQNHKILGRVREGMVFENDEGHCIVVKVIAKSEDFDGEFEVTDFENEMARKRLEAEKKAEAKQKKIARDKAERERKKAELEQKKAELEK